MKKIFITFMFFFTCYFNVFSDDSYGTLNPTIGAFEIQNNNDIEMTDEVVEIWENHVKVVFHFTNLSSKKQKVEIGFPVRWTKNYFHFSGDDVDTEDTDEFRKKIQDFYQFKSTCNGKNLPRKLICNLNTQPLDIDGYTYNYWFVTELSFEPNEVLEVVDEYNASYFEGGDSIGGKEKKWEYILTTGSTWANKIKEATIIFHAKDIYYWNNYSINKTSSEPTNYYFDVENLTSYCCYVPQEPDSLVHDTKNKEYIFTWNLKNIEPQENWEMGISTYDIKRRPFESPFNGSFIDEITVLYLLQDELFNISSFKKLCKKYNSYYAALYGISEDDSETLYIDRRDSVIHCHKEQFIKSLNRMIKACFPKEKEKSKVAKIYAQFYINSIYAIHGYKFQNKMWQEVFSNFYWYEPTVSDLSEISFSKEEQKLIDNLISYR